MQCLRSLHAVCRVLALMAVIILVHASPGGARASQYGWVEVSYQGLDYATYPWPYYMDTLGAPWPSAFVTLQESHVAAKIRFELDESGNVAVGGQAEIIYLDILATILYHLPPDHECLVDSSVSGVTTDESWLGVVGVAPPPGFATGTVTADSMRKSLPPSAKRPRRAS